MAGDWIKMECETPDKPEVLSLTALMGWDDPDLTVGKLFRLWRWFDQHTCDGNACGVTPALLDRVLGVTGFVTKVAQVGWLEIDAAGIRLKNFDRHNGATAKTRALTAKRVSKHKGNAAPKAGNAKGNGSSVTSPLPREEKRREEVNTSPTPSVPGRFEDFWNAWPRNERKQDKAKCQAKWKQLKADHIADQILADIAIKTQTQKWLTGFIEAPLVYLNNKRWEDGQGDEQTASSRFAGAI